MFCLSCLSFCGKDTNKFYTKTSLCPCTNSTLCWYYSLPGRQVYMGLIILLKVGACLPATFLYYLLPPPFGVHPQCVHGLLAFVYWGLIIFLSPPPSLCCFVGVATVAPCWLEVLGHVMAQPAMCFTPNVLIYQQRREIVMIAANSLPIRR